MCRTELLIAAFQRQMGRDYNWKDYIKAGIPFGTGQGAKVWIEHGVGTTVN